MSAIKQYDDHPEPVLFYISTSEHFDYRSIHTFKNLCNDKLEREACVTIDMAITRYVDSSGMALLHCLQHWINAPLVTVRVVNCCPQLCDLFSRSRLSHHILVN